MREAAAMPDDSTTTAVRFDTTPFGSAVPYVANVGGIMFCEVTCASVWVDVERLGESIGQRIRLNGPQATVGVLRSFDYDAETDTARFTIETDGIDERRPTAND
jgi:hypothetical protein